MQTDCIARIDKAFGMEVLGQKQASLISCLLMMEFLNLYFSK